VSVENDELSRRPNTSKTTMNVEKFENIPTKTTVEQFISSETSSGSFMVYYFCNCLRGMRQRLAHSIGPS
jgi:hypothetical protein